MDARGRRIIADQIAYYRARAPEYDKTFHGGHDAELIAALDAATPRGRVLELASGTGVWTQSLVRHPVESILAVDAAPEMLTIHAERVVDDRITRVTADLFSWQAPDRFDFVTFAFWLSHVPRRVSTSSGALCASAWCSSAGDRASSGLGTGSSGARPGELSPAVVPASPPRPAWRGWPVGGQRRGPVGGATRRPA